MIKVTQVFMIPLASDGVVNSKGLSYGYPLDNPFNKVCQSTSSALTNTMCTYYTSN